MQTPTSQGSLFRKIAVRAGVYKQTYLNQRTGNIETEIAYVSPEYLRRSAWSTTEMLRRNMDVPVCLDHQDNAVPRKKNADAWLSDEMRNSVGLVRGVTYDPETESHEYLFEISDPVIAEKIKQGIIRKVSPNFHSEFSPGDGSRWKNVVGHLALTFRPKDWTQSPGTIESVAVKSDQRRFSILSSRQSHIMLVPMHAMRFDTLKSIARHGEDGSVTFKSVDYTFKFKNKSDFKDWLSRRYQTTLRMSVSGRNHNVLYFAVIHAPIGGIVINGKRFLGGQFIPTTNMEGLAPEERKRIEKHAAESDKKRAEYHAKFRNENETWHEALSRHVGDHAQGDQSPEDVLATKKRLSSLRGHHGTNVMSRITALAGSESAQLAKLDPESDKAKHIKRRLRAYHEMGKMIAPADMPHVEPMQAAASETKEQARARIKKSVANIYTMPNAHSNAMAEMADAAKDFDANYKAINSGVTAQQAFDADHEIPAQHNTETDHSKPYGKENPWHAKRPEVFEEMKRLNDEYMQHEKTNQSMQPQHGTIGIGGADLDSLIKREVAGGYYRALSKGLTPEDAHKEALEAGRHTVKNWNEKTSKGRVSVSGAYHNKRWEGSGDAYADDIHRRFSKLDKKHPTAHDVSDAFLKMSDNEQRKYIESGKATDDEKLMATNRASVPTDQLERYDQLGKLIRGKGEASRFSKLDNKQSIDWRESLKGKNREQSIGELKKHEPHELTFDEYENHKKWDNEDTGRLDAEFHPEGVTEKVAPRHKLSDQWNRSASKRYTEHLRDKWEQARDKAFIDGKPVATKPDWAMSRDEYKKSSGNDDIEYDQLTDRARKEGKPVFTAGKASTDAQPVDDGDAVKKVFGFNKDDLDALHSNLYIQDESHSENYGKARASSRINNHIGTVIKNISQKAKAGTATPEEIAAHDAVEVGKHFGDLRSKLTELGGAGWQQANYNLPDSIEPDEMASSSDRYTSALKGVKSDPEAHEKAKDSHQMYSTFIDDVQKKLDTLSGERNKLRELENRAYQKGNRALEEKYKKKIEEKEAEASKAMDEKLSLIDRKNSARHEMITNSPDLPDFVKYAHMKNKGYRGVVNRDTYHAIEPHAIEYAKSKGHPEEVGKHLAEALSQGVSLEDKEELGKYLNRSSGYVENQNRQKNEIAKMKSTPGYDDLGDYEKERFEKKMGSMYDYPDSVHQEVHAAIQKNKEEDEAKKYAAKKEAEDAQLAKEKSARVKVNIGNLKVNHTDISPDDMREAVEHAVHTHSLPHTNFTKPKPFKPESYHDEAMDRYSSKATMAQKGAWTDGKSLVKIPKEMQEKAKADNPQGRAPDVDTIWKLAESAKLPAKVHAMYGSGADSDKQKVIIKADNGEHRVIPLESHNRIMSLHPDATPYIPHRFDSQKNYISYKDANGNIVGVGVPLMGNGEVNLNHPEVGEKLQLHEIAKQGPYSEKDMATGKEYVSSMRDRLDFVASPDGSAKIHVKDNKIVGYPGEYKNKAHAVSAAKHILSFVHGTDDNGNLIFKPKGDKSDLSYTPEQKAKQVISAEVKSLPKSRITATLNSTDDSRQQVNGIKVGHFLVHKGINEKDKSKTVVSHIHSGKKASEVDSQERGMELAHLLGKNGDWSKADISNDDLSHAGHVVAAHNRKDYQTLAKLTQGKKKQNTTGDVMGFSVVHAPVGGSDVDGHHYLGGQFTPGSGTESAIVKKHESTKPVHQQMTNEQISKAAMDFASHEPSYQAMKQKYIATHGTFDEQGNLKSIPINVDDWRDYLPGYNGTNASLVHAAASKANVRFMHEMLEQMKGKGNGKAVILGGGGGSGKGTSVGKHFDQSEYPIRIDQTSRDYDRLLQDIEQLKGHGYTPDIVFVDRAPNAAWHGVTGRAIESHKNGHNPRTVPVDTAIKANIDARNAALRLAKERPDVPLRVINNNVKDHGDISLLENRDDIIRHLSGQQYNYNDEIEKAVNHVRQRQQSGELPEHIASGLLGERYSQRRQADTA